MPTPSPEQTASWVSLAIHSYLDPTVWLAYRVPHLAFEQLPPLADYDRSAHLVQRSFDKLDPFQGGLRSHLFWALLRVFRGEYIFLAVMIVLRVVISFASPLGINRLLHYIETRGEDALVRPWVWISWLFLGPVVGSILWQGYIFVTTRMMVRAEAMVTQLVFEHALRVRMKAEVPDAASQEPAQPADDSDSDGSVDETLRGNVSEAESATTNVPANGESNGSPTKKGKKKAPSVTSTETSRTHADGSSKADNLVGRINNLITTDLGNLIDGRDFLLIGECPCWLCSK